MVLRRSPRKDKYFLVKLGLSLVLFFLAFMLFHNRPSILFSLYIARQNADQIPKQDAQNSHISASDATSEENRDSMKDGNGEKCDLSVGDWVRYEEEPLYNKNCSFISYQNCIKNGRPDSEYLHWRWKPHGCDLPRLDPMRFLEMMRNKSWAFVGDSISRNHFESFICTLTTVEEAALVYRSEDSRSQKWAIPSYNFTTSIIWSPFIAQAHIPAELYHYNGSQSEIHLHLDKLDKDWTTHFNSWDYTVFSTGKWFGKPTIYYDHNTTLGCNNCPNKNLTKLGQDFAHRKVLKTLFDYITGSGHKGTVFYRTITPDHYKDGYWNTGGSCRKRQPAEEELSWGDMTIRSVEMEEIEKALVKGYENGVNLRVLDVTGMLLLRPDGHPDVYMVGYHFGKDKKEKMHSDCMHWCLPGPIDTWSDVLMEMVENIVHKT